MSRMKSLFLILCSLCLTAGAFAQTKAALTVIVDEGPAQVFLNGKLLGIANPNLVAKTSVGTYELLAKKPGRPDFRQTINLGVRGLVVEVSFRDGSHQSAPEPKPEPKPQPKVRHQVSISANAPGARVTMNGIDLGQAPIQTSLEEGSYQISINAPGYENYSATISVNGETRHQASMRAIFSTISISIPARFQDRGRGHDSKDRDRSRDDSSVEFYIDGTRIQGQSAQVQSGRRQVRLVVGSLSVERSIDVEPGRSYTVEPDLILNVR